MGDLDRSGAPAPFHFEGFVQVGQGLFSPALFKVGRAYIVPGDGEAFLVLAGDGHFYIFPKVGDGNIVNGAGIIEQAQAVVHPGQVPGSGQALTDFQGGQEMFKCRLVFIEIHMQYPQQIVATDQEGIGFESMGPDPMPAVRRAMPGDCPGAAIHAPGTVGSYKGRHPRQSPFRRAAGGCRPSRFALQQLG